VAAIIANKTPETARVCKAYSDRFLSKSNDKGQDGQAQVQPGFDQGTEFDMFAAHLCLASAAALPLKPYGRFSLLGSDMTVAR